MVSTRHSLLCAICACLAGTASAQPDWPTHGDVLDRGSELSETELRGIMDAKTAVVILGLEGPLFGRIFSCDGDGSILFEFIPPGTSEAAESGTVPCEISGSSICFDPNGEWAHCLAVRRLPESTHLFTGFVDEDLPGLREVPAQVLGILPVDVNRLAAPAGEIDFGPFAISLPADLGLTLREGRGLPLGLNFGVGEEGGFEVQTAIWGWPDAMTQTPAPRTPEPGDRKRAETEIESQEADFGEVKRRLYEATRLEFSTGPCIRIREHIANGHVDDGTGMVLPDKAAFYQMCISPSAGTLMLVETHLVSAKSEDELLAFEEASMAILDSLRLGFAPTQ